MVRRSPTWWLGPDGCARQWARTGAWGRSVTAPLMRSTYGCHICTRTGLTPATSAHGLGSPPATSAPEPGCGALHMYVETEPSLSAACQKGPTEGREHPAAGFGLRVLISMGLGALGAVGPLGSASGTQQARGHPAPASTHARDWRCRRGRFALRLPHWHWQRPWRRAVLSGLLRGTLVSRSFRNLDGRFFVIQR